MLAADTLGQGMTDLNHILIFVSVVEQRGIGAAADRLDMAKSRVSRAITELEARLGTRLFERSTRAFRITDEGRLYYEHSRRALDELAMADASVQHRRDEMAGTLRVSAAVIMGKYLLGAVVKEFLGRHPKARIVAEVGDRIVDLVPEGVDLAIRLGDAGGGSSLVTRLLARPKAGLYASAGYLREHGLPRTPQDLAAHRTLDLGPADKQTQWLLRRGDVSTRVRLNPVLLANDMPTLLQCAVAGMGICLVPHFVCQAELPQTQLRQVVPDWYHDAPEVRAMVASHRSVTPLLRAFLDLLVERAPALLEAPPLAVCVDEAPLHR
jgi:DNA-binding transcriptional LysR family regulator